jgi:hypothetical protein
MFRYSMTKEPNGRAGTFAEALARHLPARLHAMLWDSIVIMRGEPAIVPVHAGIGCPTTYRVAR